MAYTINNDRIARNTMALYIRMGFIVIISFLTARVTLQVLGVDDYGLNNLVGSVVALFSFINGSMGTAVQRFYNIEIGRKDDVRLKRVFSAGLYCHIIVAIITLFLTELFALFFLDKLNIPPERMFAAQVVFQLSILQMLLNIICVPYSALLRAHERFSDTAKIDIVQSVLRLVILYLLYVISFDKLIVLAALNLGVTVLFVGANVLLALQHKESNTIPSRDKEIIKEMLNFISLLLITVMMQVVRDKGIVLLINLFFSLAINAAYAVAMQVSGVVNTFVMSFKQSVVPQMMSAYGAGDKQSMFKLLTTGTKITFMLMLMISLPIVAEAQYILELWLKTPPDHTTLLVILVMINVNIASFTSLFYQAVHATGRITVQQVVMSMIFALNVLGIFVTFKLGASFEMALYVTIFSSILQCILNVYCAKKNLDYSVLLFVKDLLIPSLLVIVVSSCVVFGLKFLMPSGFLRLLMVLLVSTLAIFTSSMTIMFNKSEREKVLSFVGKYINKFKRK